MAQSLPKARTYLTPDEVRKLMDQAGRGRRGQRNACLIFLMFRHGLRIAEALGLKLAQVDLNGKRIHMNRLKNGFSSPHPLREDELRLIKSWLKEREKMLKSIDSEYLFCSSKGHKLADAPFRVWFPKMGKEAGLSFHVHPHMLRHSCGYALAEQGADTRLIQDYLGHRNISQTVKYTASNPARFERLWR